jgi:hypothetical protein
MGWRTHYKARTTLQNFNPVLVLKQKSERTQRVEAPIKFEVAPGIDRDAAHIEVVVHSRAPDELVTPAVFGSAWIRSTA